MDRIEIDRCWTKSLLGLGRRGCCSGKLQTQASNNNRKNNRRNKGRSTCQRQRGRTLSEA